MWFTVLITPLISSNFPCWSLHCLSCDLPFWLPLWYLQTFLVGQCIACLVIYRSDYHFDIFKLFCIASCDLPFWLPHWYLQTFLVGHCIACHVIYSSDYPFDIFKLSVIVLLVMWFTVLITPLISSNFSCWSLYCLSCDLPFWLPLWYLQTFLVGHCIACHVIYRSDYPFDIFKPFLLVIVLPVMWFTVLITPLISSNFSCWSLYCLSCDLPFWLPLWYLQTFLVGHCIACHVIYRSDYPFDIFKLFLLVIVLPVMWFTVLITLLISSNFSCWSLYCLSCDLPFWLPLWYLQTFLVGHCIACHVIYRSDYPLISSNFSCWSLYCLSCDLPFWLPLWYLQTFLVGHCIACHVIYSSDYPFDIFKLFLLVIVLLVMWFTVLITPLISSNFSCWSLYFLSCDITFWWRLWYLQTFLVGHCISCHVIYRSDYPFDIFKLVGCWSCWYCIACHVIYSSDYQFDIFKLFLLVIVLPVMWFTVLITPWYLQTFLVGHCISCHMIYVLITTLISSNFPCWSLPCLSCELPFWLPLWYLQTFLVGHCISCLVIYRSDYPFDIFKLSLLVIVLLVMWFTVLITPLISSNLSCRSLYCLSCDLQFWLPLWYLQTFLVGHCISCHVIYRSDYPFDIFKLFLLVIVFPVMWFTVLITPLISSSFSCWSVYCLSCDLPFWLPLWYLQTFLVGHCIACHVIYSSDYPFDIFKLSLLVIALLVMWFTVLITPLISSNFSCWSVYCLSCDLPFWLPLWYLQTFLVGHCIACHVIYRSDYPIDIFKPFL